MLIGRVWTKTIRENNVYALVEGFCRNNCIEKYCGSFKLGKDIPGLKSTSRKKRMRGEKANNV